MALHLAFVILSGVASLGCLVHLWQREGVGPIERIVWSLLVWMPLFGPVFYGGFFEIPKPDRNKRHWPEDFGGIP